jgi:hypothetical protein
VNFSRIEAIAPSDIEDGTNHSTREPRGKRERARLERDLARGYSINVKQVVLAFAVEFVIIGLILASRYGGLGANPADVGVVQELAELIKGAVGGLWQTFHAVA